MVKGPEQFFPSTGGPWPIRKIPELSTKSPSLHRDVRLPLIDEKRTSLRNAQTPVFSEADMVTAIRFMSASR
jgi:hypothetical protein